jgi:CHASE2 domain-containing sensor protein
VAAVALAGLGLSLTPLADRVDNSSWTRSVRTLRRFDRLPAPDDIAIVGIDEASLRAIPEPPALWHAALGRVLTRLAQARPRPSCSTSPFPSGPTTASARAWTGRSSTASPRPVEAAPFVAALNIDPRTRSARPIHKPYLALLGESRLGLSLLARDDDGVARRYSLVIPTEDGGFPTLEGRLCRALKAGCGEGLIHYSLGKPFAYVPFKNLMEMADDELVRGIFRGRIVLIGEAQAFSGRVEVPVNLAAWESDARNTPGIVLRAQTLRTALANAAPREASRPLALVLVTLAAFIVLMRDWRMAGVHGAGRCGRSPASPAWPPFAGACFLPLAAPLATWPWVWRSSACGRRARPER